MSRALPLQSADFPELRRSAQAYIDKTRDIALVLADTRRRHLFLSRPRRFGKTLLVSTLEALFQGHRDLFAGTWIDHDDHWDWAQGPYAVMRLDMTLFTGAIRNLSALEEGLYEGVASLYETFALPLPATARQAYILFGRLIQRLAQETGQKTVVLVDEYDTPVTANLARPHLLPAITDTMRSFYGILKTCYPYIHCAFMTGITRVSDLGLFSGANHFLDLSFAPEASTLLGYTQDELLHNEDIWAAVERGAHNLGCGLSDLVQALEQQYNGYLFATGSEPVYNPFSLNKCLDALQHPVWSRRWHLGKLPTYWAESGTPHLLFHVWRQNLGSAPKDPMKADIQGIEEANLSADKPDLAPLMYQSGYLTRKCIQDPTTGREREVLALPNAEVEDTYLSTFRNWLAKERDRWQTDRLESPLTRQLRQAAETRRARDIYNAVNALLPMIPSNLHFPRAAGGKKMSDYEAYCHSHLHLMFGMAGLTVESEKYADGGRMDMGVVIGEHALVFELKVNGDAEQAARQAMTRWYASPWRDGSKAVTVFGLNFASSQRLLEKCVKWDLGFFDPGTARWDREPVPDTPLDSLRGWTGEALVQFEAAQAIDWDEVHTLQTRPIRPARQF